MTITDEYLEVNSKSKWMVCFCDVEEFYRADYDVIGIRYKKDHENWRPDDEIAEESVERKRTSMHFCLTSRILR